METGRASWKARILRAGSRRGRGRGSVGRPRLMRQWQRCHRSRKTKAHRYLRPRSPRGAPSPDVTLRLPLTARFEEFVHGFILRPEGTLQNLRVGYRPDALLS